MKGKEIIHANIKITHKKKKITIPGVLILIDDTVYNNKRVLKKYGIKEEVIIEEIEKITSLGFQNITDQSTSFEKSDESRNKITGAYE